VVLLLLRVVPVPKLDFLARGADDSHRKSSADVVRRATNQTVRHSDGSYLVASGGLRGAVDGVSDLKTVQEGDGRRHGRGVRKASEVGGRGEMGRASGVVGVQTPPGPQAAAGKLRQPPPCGRSYVAKSHRLSDENLVSLSRDQGGERALELSAVVGRKRERAPRARLDDVVGGELAADNLNTRVEAVAVKGGMPHPIPARCEHDVLRRDLRLSGLREDRSC